jgi:hypothetical protein
MRKFIFILIVVAFTVNTMAQEECAYVLEEAQEMFDAGLIENIPDKLAGCLASGFTNEEQLQAHKLIILSYLFDDNLEKADEAMFYFLSEYPAYEPVATDPREFTLLMDTYDTDPILMLGGGVGVNFSFPIMVEEMGVHNVSIHTGNLVPGRSGFHANFMVERQLIPNLHILGELSIANVVFDNYLDDESGDIVSSAEITDYSVIEYKETQNQIRLPISASYNFTETDFKPYVRVGIVPAVLLSAKAEAARSNLIDGIIYPQQEVANVDVYSGRRAFNMWAFAGGGFNYKLGPGNFFLDLRYHMNLLNQMKPNSDPFQFGELTWEIFYVNDKFLLNNVTATLGYMFPLYRPKKKDQ